MAVEQRRLLGLYKCIVLSIQAWWCGELPHHVRVIRKGASSDMRHYRKGRATQFEAS